MNLETPLDLLIGETERVNPAILLAEEFMRRDAADLLSADEIDRAAEVLNDGRAEIQTIRRQIAAFASGAQYVSTDYMTPDPRLSTYRTRLPSGGVARVSPAVR